MDYGRVPLEVNRTDVSLWQAGISNDANWSWPVDNLDRQLSTLMGHIYSVFPTSWSEFYNKVRYDSQWSIYSEAYWKPIPAPLFNPRNYCIPSIDVRSITEHAPPATSVVFEHFPKLPIEIRTMVWKLCLPKPRVVQIGPAHEPTTTTMWPKILNSTQCRITCRESRDIFKRFYHQVDIVHRFKHTRRPIGYVDGENDTVMVSMDYVCQNLVPMSEVIDLRKIRNLAMAYAESILQPFNHQALSSLLRICPLLKMFTVILGNVVPKYNIHSERDKEHVYYLIEVGLYLNNLEVSMVNGYNSGHQVADGRYIPFDINEYTSEGLPEKIIRAANIREQFREAKASNPELAKTFQSVELHVAIFARELPLRHVNVAPRCLDFPYKVNFGTWRPRLPSELPLLEIYSDSDGDAATADGGVGFVFTGHGGEEDMVSWYDGVKELFDETALEEPLENMKVSS